MCQLAINEDLGVLDAKTDDSENNHFRDITAELIEPDTQATALLITRESGVLCGTEWVNIIFKILGGDVQINWLLKDGDNMVSEQTICELKGNARQLLTGERSAMNFLQSLSATATLTNQYVNKIADSRCQLLDTRKTIPGMRYGQKYAVKCGGGTNHRIGLSDAYLIKENHIMACGGIKKALSKAIEMNPDKLLEIEVENIEELKQAIEGKAQVIMLDNFTNPQIKQALTLRDEAEWKPKFEASGNVNLDTIYDIAQTGVDYISVGALTKDIKAIDLSMRITLI